MAIPIVLVFFRAISTIFTPPCTADSILYPGNRILEGESITTGNYAFKMEDDCNLVLYESRTLTWQTNTSGKGSGCYATLLVDYGEFVIKDNTGKTVWTSDTKQSKVTSCVLILQRDRNVVLYCGTPWATKTNVKSGLKALGRKMGIGKGGDDIHRASVLVNSEGESEQLGSMITQVVNE